MSRNDNVKSHSYDDPVSFRQFESPYSQALIKEFETSNVCDPLNPSQVFIPLTPNSQTQSG